MMIRIWNEYSLADVISPWPMIATLMLSQLTKSIYLISTDDSSWSLWSQECFDMLLTSLSECFKRLRTSRILTCFQLFSRTPCAAVQRAERTCAGGGQCPPTVWSDLLPTIPNHTVAQTGSMSSSQTKNRGKDTPTHFLKINWYENIAKLRNSNILRNLIVERKNVYWKNSSCLLKNQYGKTPLTVLCEGGRARWPWTPVNMAL